MPLLPIKSFPYGLLDSIESESVPRGAASNLLNWIHKGDLVELRRGYAVLGNESAVITPISALFVATKQDGTEIAFRTRGQILEYLNEATDTWTEIGTNVLGSAADGDEIAFTQYNSPAGDQLWINSPNGPFLKIMLANPGSYTDMYDSTLNFKGYIKTLRNALALWGRLADKTGYYRSYIDEKNYTTVTAEAIAGSGTTRSGTLAFKAAGAKRTCFAVTFTDGVETFIDNRDGTLTGSAGGSGTINYTSGAYAITFAASATTVTSTYQWEDSTSGGLADFTFSATRVAGEGFYLAQDDGGGNLMDIYTYGGSEYCMHEKKSWVVTSASNDATITNLVYREKVGIPKRGAGVATGDGIFYIDNSGSTDPEIKVLQFDVGGTEVRPVSVSKQHKFEGQSIGLNLNGYLFSLVWFTQWGDNIKISCRTDDTTSNNRVLLYNRTNKVFSWHDYFTSCTAVYNGTLIAGDPINSNVYTLFSGYDDDNAVVDGTWDSNYDNLGHEGEKRARFIGVEGLIQSNQDLEVWRAVDDGNFTLVGTILGDGAYVDTGINISIGNTTLGSKPIGGGGGATAYHFRWQKKISGSKFYKQKIRFRPSGIGYCAFSLIEMRDFRIKSNRINRKYI